MKDLFSPTLLGFIEVAEGRAITPRSINEQQEDRFEKIDAIKGVPDLPLSQFLTPQAFFFAFDLDLSSQIQPSVVLRLISFWRLESLQGVFTPNP